MEVQGGWATKERDEARERANDAQRGVITMFNEQERFESLIGQTLLWTR